MGRQRERRPHPDIGIQLGSYSRCPRDARTSGVAESRELRSNSQTLDGVFRPLEPNTLRKAVWDLSSSMLGEPFGFWPRKVGIFLWKGGELSAREPPHGDRGTDIGVHCEGYSSAVGSSWACDLDSLFQCYRLLQPLLGHIQGLQKSQGLRKWSQCVCRLLLTLEAHHLPLPHDSSSFSHSDFGNSSLAFLPGLAPPGILQALPQYSPLWPLPCWLMAPSSLSLFSEERSQGCSCSAIIAGPQLASTWWEIFLAAPHLLRQREKVGCEKSLGAWLRGMVGKQLLCPNPIPAPRLLVSSKQAHSSCQCRHECPGCEAG